MIAFTLGFPALGSIVKALVLPRFVQRVSQDYYLSTFYLSLLFSSIFFLLVYGYFNHVFLAFLVCLYGIIFQVSAHAINAVSRNMLLKTVLKEEYATAYSIQNMPGFAGTAIYSWYLTIYKEGAPSVREALISISILAIFGLLTHLLSSKIRRSSHT